jgi:enoyl-CoA hydratase/carnithine racemase
MSDELVKLDRRDDGVAVVTLAHGKVNALSVAVLDRVQSVATDLTDDPPGAVLITGGPRVFAAGADITEFASDPDPASFVIAPGERVREVGGAFLAALGAVAAIPRPTIASISGFALGGGCELALACDLRIASTRAKFGQPEILLGIIPGGGGTQRLARLVGPSRAKDLIFSGRQVAAAEALSIGLVDRVTEPDELDAAALAWAAELAAGPSDALAIAKRVIDGGLDLPLDAALLGEQDGFVEVFATGDATVGVRSFLEHGPGQADFHS